MTRLTRRQMKCPECQKPVLVLAPAETPLPELLLSATCSPGHHAAPKTEHKRNPLKASKKK